jgi:hypothetical protein
VNEEVPLWLDRSCCNIKRIRGQNTPHKSSDRMVASTKERTRPMYLKPHTQRAFLTDHDTAEFREYLRVTCHPSEPVTRSHCPVLGASRGLVQPIFPRQCIHGRGYRQSRGRHSPVRKCQTWNCGSNVDDTGCFRLFVSAACTERLIVESNPITQHSLEHKTKCSGVSPSYNHSE